MTVTPQRGIRDPQSGQSGFFHTDDGSLVIGQPHVEANWFPVNDHPLDKASYTVRMTVPEGLEVVVNGRLVDNRTRDGLTTWTWEAREPMAAYLATASVGQSAFNQYKAGRVSYLDAPDPDLVALVAEPRTGTGLAWSRAADSSDKRLTRTFTVPDDGAQLSFWLIRSTETK